ncbi:DUF748 domain-containing protein [Niveibacterium sp. 24ML]|uniref:DUF748 domain-containing protein n=1 Tax=Niveibacterium sp. 24ML TaxID=2985512 RepID=UPI00226DA208|nr:DUF748 domain-containing protein [Niveibacterium sp. 24ML]MCX9156220.1 DUF748 domain-containing protein [Niveibacterium sp. 24ML]
MLPLLRRRLVVGTLAVLAALLVLLPLAYHIALKRLTVELESVLGERSRVGAIELGWNALVLRDVVVSATPAWPVKEELRAASVRVKPALLSLFSRDVLIREVVLEEAYLSMLRTRKGQLRILPAVLEADTAKPDTPQPGPQSPAADSEAAPELPTEPARKLTIAAITLINGAIDYCDGSVARTPHCIALRDLDGQFTSLSLPTLDAQSSLTLAGTVEGKQGQGRLNLDGTITLLNRDMDLRLNLASVDLHTFEPYLIKSVDTSVRRGRLDLNLHAKVSKRRLNAPGQLTLSELELNERSGSFMGMPRGLVVESLKGKDGRIQVDFTLQGNLDDPKFSLNEVMSTRLAASLAKGLGISLQGVVGGVGGATSGIGEGLKRLFGGD